MPLTRSRSSLRQHLVPFPILSWIGLEVSWANVTTCDYWPVVLRSLAIEASLACVSRRALRRKLSAYRSHVPPKDRDLYIVSHKNMGEKCVGVKGDK